ncbi:MAG: stage II sporulation protein M [Eubacterium sp.]|nr:stage II sporulation protein M [Eubacterium sp.]
MQDSIKIKKDLSQIIVGNKDYIYSSMFYLAGLILGAFIFRITNNSALSKLIEIIIKSTQTTFSAVFLNRFFLYFSIYVLCVLLGMCLIGFPLLNSVPFIIGLELAIKISYFYVNYKIKGIGFSLLMIIPEGAAVTTVLIYSIKTSTNLSKKIYALSKGNGNEIGIDTKEYFKQYILYALIITAISLINALISFLIGGIVKM